MKKTIIAAAGLALLLQGACARKVIRIGTEETKDLSGKWNDTDSRLVSEEMVSSALEGNWVTDYMSATSRRPRVIVGTVLNKTDEHIITGTFTKDLERAFINSGRVEMAASSGERLELREERQDMQEYSSRDTRKELRQESAADFMLKGVINKIKDKYGKKQVVYYQIDLELVDTESNRKVWIGDKKIKKFIKR